MQDFFSNYSAAKVYYSAQADRLFIFHEATFLMLPSLEREDGKCMILNDPQHVFELCNLPKNHRFKLDLIGDF